MVSSLNEAPLPIRSEDVHAVTVLVPVRRGLHAPIDVKTRPWPTRFPNIISVRSRSSLQRSPAWSPARHGGCLARTPGPGPRVSVSSSLDQRAGRQIPTAQPATCLGDPIGEQPATVGASAAGPSRAAAPSERPLLLRSPHHEVPRVPLKLGRPDSSPAWEWGLHVCKPAHPRARQQVQAPPRRSPRARERRPVPAPKATRYPASRISKESPKSRSPTTFSRTPPRARRTGASDQIVGEPSDHSA